MPDIVLHLANLIWIPETHYGGELGGQDNRTIASEST